MPVDFKPISLSMELPKKRERFTEQSMDLTGTDASIELDQGNLDLIVQTKYNEIKDKIKENLRTALYDQDIILGTRENDWYKHLANVLDKLLHHHAIPENMIKKFIVYHNLDTLTFDERMILVQHTYKSNPSELVAKNKEISIDASVTDTDYDELIDDFVKTYFDNKIIVGTGMHKKGIVLVRDFFIDDKTRWKIYFQDEHDRLSWKEIEEFEYADFRDIRRLIIDRSKINKFFGFINIFKNGITVFKTKTVSSNGNNKGVFCNVLGKTDILNRLNTLLESTIYTNEFIKNKHTTTVVKKGIRVEKETENGIYKDGLCVILEIILRYYNEIDYKNKIWFFDFEMAAINDVVGIKT
jgi:hypothetical protein